MRQGGVTALHLAASVGHLDIVELLLKKGADAAVATEARGPKYSFSPSRRLHF